MYKDRGRIGDYTDYSDTEKTIRKEKEPTLEERVLKLEQLVDRMQDHIAKLFNPDNDY